jgi:hypothetical protein
MDAEPRNRWPAQDIPVQEEPREGNGDRRECRPAANQPHGRAPTPPPCRVTRDNNRRSNESANVDANTDADAPPLFRPASQNLAAAVMLLRGCPEAVASCWGDSESSLSYTKHKRVSLSVQTSMRKVQQRNPRSH